MPENLEPPVAASRMLSRFSDPHLTQVLGDLMEEFNERVRSTGIPAARRWYWREAVRNAFILIWRKRLIGTALIAILAIYCVNIIEAQISYFAWRLWMAATMSTTHYTPSSYRDGWGAGWPGGFVFEVIFAPIVALVISFLFAHALRDRAKQFRMAAVLLWAAMITTVTVWLFGLSLNLLNLPSPDLALYIKQRLLMEFLARGGTAVGAFWIGAGLALPHKQSAQQ